jgi:putative oxidoreductase
MFGIPAPAFHAVFVGNVEFLRGLTLLVGLGTRLVSLPLACTMLVAIFTSAIKDVEGIADFLALDEFLYLAVLLWLTLILKRVTLPGLGGDSQRP